MSDYDCKNHTLDFCCSGCVKAWIARHNKLLAFVKELAQRDTDGFLTATSVQARNLLLEIGELND